MNIIITDTKQLKRKLNEQNKKELSNHKKRNRVICLETFIALLLCVIAVIVKHIIISYIMALVAATFFSLVFIQILNSNNSIKGIKEKENEIYDFCEFLDDYKKGKVIIYDYDDVIYYYNKFDDKKTLLQINCPVSLTEIVADEYEYSKKETTLDFDKLICAWGEEEVPFFGNFIEYDAKKLYKILVNNGFWEGNTEPQITEIKKELTVDERERLTKSLTMLQNDMQEILFKK